MKNGLRWATAAVVSLGIAGAASVEADARRGAELFTKHHCVACHSVEGHGAKAAPDLGKRLDREYAPAGLASRMWNHAPTMWAAMKSKGIDIPQVSEADAADLFAFFYAARYFEKPGDAGRGKRVFDEKRCGDCHAMTGTSKAAAVAQWGSLRDPLELSQKMWSHARPMFEANREAKRKWPELSGQEMADLLVWLQNRPEQRGARGAFVLPGGTRGKELLAARDCNTCHGSGKMRLEYRLSGRTLTEVAAAMWNHAPLMKGKFVDVSAEDMRQILAYTWAAQFVRPDGNEARGAKIFTANCAVCHEKGEAPKLGAHSGSYSTLTMVSALFRHGPKMLAAAEKAGRGWPKLNSEEMANLVTFLDSGKR